MQQYLWELFFSIGGWVVLIGVWLILFGMIVCLLAIIFRAFVVLYEYIIEKIEKYRGRW